MIIPFALSYGNSIDSGRHCRRFTTLWLVLGYVLFEKCDMNHMKQHRFFLEDKIVQIDTVLFYRKCTRHSLKMGRSLRLFLWLTPLTDRDYPEIPNKISESDSQEFSFE